MEVTAPHTDTLGLVCPKKNIGNTNINLLLKAAGLMAGAGSWEASDQPRWKKMQELSAGVAGPQSPTLITWRLGGGWTRRLL